MIRRIEMIGEITKAIHAYLGADKIPKYVLAPESYYDPIKEEFRLLSRDQEPMECFPPVFIHGVQIVFSPWIKRVEVVRE